MGQLSPEEGHHRQRSSPGSELQRDPCTQGLAEQVDTPGTELVEVRLDSVGQGWDGGWSAPPRSIQPRGRPAGDVDYEKHGAGYAVLRQPDPRIAARVRAARRHRSGEGGCVDEEAVAQVGGRAAHACRSGCGTAVGMMGP